MERSDEIEMLKQQVTALKAANTELVQTVQKLKVVKMEKDNEKLELTKELNHLRMKLCRIQSGGAAQAQALEAAIQSTLGEAATHLMEVSNLMTSTLQVARNYMQDRHELHTSSPRWSALSSPVERLRNEVRPMSIGGRSIQPVVALHRISVTNNTQSRSVPQVVSRVNTERRALPMHLLQDLYIPLTRIDTPGFRESAGDVAGEDSPEENEGDMSDNDNSIDNIDDLDTSRDLYMIQEDRESNLDSSRDLEENIEESANGERISRILSPLNRPVEEPRSSNVACSSRAAILSIVNEPDSTTPLEPTTPIMPISPQVPTIPLLPTVLLFPITPRRLSSLSRPNSPLRPSSPLLPTTIQDSSAPLNDSLQDVQCRDFTPTVRRRRKRASFTSPKVLEKKQRRNSVFLEDSPAFFGFDTKPSGSKDVASVTVVLEDSPVRNAEGRPSGSKDITSVVLEDTPRSESRASGSKDKGSGRVPKVSLAKLRLEGKSSMQEEPIASCSQISPPQDGRVLKVSLAKLRLEGKSSMQDEPIANCSQISPPQETTIRQTSGGSDVSADNSRRSSTKRVRRSRKEVIYKEKSLNKKLRR